MRNINYHPFNSFYSLKTSERIKEIENQIKEEKNQPIVDKHKIYRLEEQKLVEGMFSNDQLGSTYSKYRKPWLL